MDEHCTECGFVYELGRAAEAAAEIIREVAGISALLADEAEPAARREPSTWSPLEYACHVRDVLLVQRERVLTARRRDRPVLEPMGRDERVEHDGYSAQQVGDVLRQLDDAARLFRNVLNRLEAADWERRVVYSYPEPQERPLAWVAVHTLHEVVHHAGDIRRQRS
ncbi:MAG: DinB family protein [Actinomycetota bacterium]|nr:DinB family protein [Actinomycetota bacterium]